MSSRTNFPGVALPLGPRTYVVPALSLRQLQAQSPRLAKLQELSVGLQKGEGGSTLMLQAVAETTELLLVALQRNYPSVTIDELSDWVDLNNFRSLVDMVMGNSGLELVREVPTGEIPPGP